MIHQINFYKMFDNVNCNLIAHDSVCLTSLENDILFKGTQGTDKFIQFRKMCRTANAILQKSQKDSRRRRLL